MSDDRPQVFPDTTFIHFSRLGDPSGAIGYEVTRALSRIEGHARDAGVEIDPLSVRITVSREPAYGLKALKVYVSAEEKVSD